MFTELTTGCGTEKLGAFLIALPMAMTRTKMTKEMVIFLFGVIAGVAHAFVKAVKVFDKQDFF